MVSKVFFFNAFLLTCIKHWGRLAFQIFLITWIKTAYSTRTVYNYVQLHAYVFRSYNCVDALNLYRCMYLHTFTIIGGFMGGAAVRPHPPWAYIRTLLTPEPSAFYKIKFFNKINNYNHYRMILRCITFLNNEFELKIWNSTSFLLKNLPIFLKKIYKSQFLASWKGLMAFIYIHI